MFFTVFTLQYVDVVFFMPLFSSILSYIVLLLSKRDARVDRHNGLKSALRVDL